MAERARDSSYNEYMESNTICLEWTLRGLKSLFESSKGDAKSKVTRSVKFGGGRWQILFYPNSGTTSDGGGYVSLYLSCEPTAEEKAAAINGKWVREGLFKFSFELRNVNKGTCFNTKEAVDHAFSHQTANWGWAQFAKREAVYYSPNTVRLQDAFLILCTITSSPAPPVPPSGVPRQAVPRDLLHAVGALLDDPLYSDVEFVLPARDGVRRSRRIWANRKLISRAEYFDTMFNSGFSEGLETAHSLNVGQSDCTPGSHQQSIADDEDPQDRSSVFGPGYLDDSDEEDGDIDDNASDGDAESLEDMNEPNTLLADTPEQGQAGPGTSDNDATTNMSTDTLNILEPKPQQALPQDSGPTKVRVVVHDVAYATYKAFLYYLYTDSIVFAPLSSNFLSLSLAHDLTSHSLLTSSSTTLVPSLKAMDVQPTIKAQPSQACIPLTDGPMSRKAWVKEWQYSNPGRPGPCSAKAIYRLADKVNLHELKSRAFQHIVKSLTVNNVAYEVFSSFSAQFDDVRKVEVDFFLAHWEDIKSSDAMRNIFQQIRMGRHPGFEEVWPCIVSNLFYKPIAIEGATGDGSGASEC